VNGYKGIELISEQVRHEYGSAYPEKQLLPHGLLVPDDCVLDLVSPQFINGDGKIVDFSGSGNHGTITGATKVRLPSGWWVLDFDGTDKIDCDTGLTLGEHTFTRWLKSSHAAGNGGIWGFPSIGFSLIGTAPLLLLGGANYQYWVDVSAYLNGVWHFWELYIAGSGQNDIDNCSLKIDGATITKDGASIKTGAPDAWTGLRIGNNTYGTLVSSLGITQVYNQAITTGTTMYNRERHLFGA